ncbi:MAG: redoxin domain-containing protein [Steroidobacteraceae bacterium]
MRTQTVLTVTGCLAALLAAAASLAAQPANPTPTAAPQKSEYQLQMEREQQEHPVLKIGAALPDFALKGVDGRIHTPADYKDSPVLMVMFISNHCPASQNYESRMKQITADYAGKGVQVIAIAPNGPQAVAPRELNYSDVDDSFDAMVERATHRQFPFPYLYDGETQAIAHQFGPKVTPHVFIFDKDRKLRFEGRIDDAMREVNAKTHETRDALDALLAGKPVAVETTPVFGCSTKWNTAVAGKQRELKEWQAKPVAVESTTLAGLQQLMKNPTGKMLMINFWATWCGPCQVEYPELLTSYLWYRSRDFEFVSVSVDAPSDRAAVTRFLGEHHSAIRNLQVDTEDVYAVQKAVDPKWQSGVPYTIVLAPDGTVVYRRDGEVDILKLRRAILANLPDVGMFAGNQAYWRQ